MKRITIAGLLAAAVALAPLSQQKAAAWGGGCGGCGGFQVGLNLGVNWQWGCGPCGGGGGCAYDCAPCPAYGCGYGGGYGGYGYGGPAVQYGGYPTCAAPVMAPPAAAPTGVQNAAYFPGAYGGQVPSYWYGH